MKSWCKGLAMLMLLSIPVMSTVTQEESYSVSEVKELLKQPPGFSSSFSEKQVSRLGDRLSIALMKIYSEAELKDPQNIKRYLPLMIDAFRFPRLIAASDREPRVTLVFFNTLKVQ